jgi:hypothetical protein
LLFNNAGRQAQRTFCFRVYRPKESDFVKLILRFPKTIDRVLIHGKLFFHYFLKKKGRKGFPLFLERGGQSEETSFWYGVMKSFSSLFFKFMGNGEGP